MKIHRFIGPFNVNESHLSLTDSQLVHRLGRVLRIQVGERILLCDGNNQEAEGVITSVDKHSIMVDLEKPRSNLSEPHVHLTLYLALIKRENFELAIEKAVELGVSEIVPLMTQRTIKQRINYERLQAILQEAAEQSGRGRVPTLHEAVSFQDVAQKVGERGHIFFFDINAPLINPATVDPATKRAAFIGPEGGWTDEERAIAQTQGWQIVGLGPRILRAETAAMMASYLLTT